MYQLPCFPLYRTDQTLSNPVPSPSLKSFSCFSLFLIPGLLFVHSYCSFSFIFSYLIFYFILYSVFLSLLELIYLPFRVISPPPALRVDGGSRISSGKAPEPGYFREHDLSRQALSSTLLHTYKTGCRDHSRVPLQCSNQLFLCSSVLPEESDCT